MILQPPCFKLQGGYVFGRFPNPYLRKTPHERDSPGGRRSARRSCLPDTIRHMLLGRPGSIRQTIHLLHNLNYSAASQWSPLIEIPDGQLILTPERGEVLSLLMKRL